ncbi:auxin-responsive protein SAUR62-like [Silene latifolia]|uniref:auxin-responsive protein SAUR62-like n=1 Tax=Silene latifolia TaxID=37657 RepID=UPI003D782880
MAKKWQRLAIASQKRITWSRPVAKEGYFVIYTTDGRRFMIPLTYLNSEIVRELLRLAEEEFGMTSSGPITLPCDSSFMEYAMSMIQRHVSEDVEKTLVSSLVACRSYEHLRTNQQLLITSC